MYIKHHFATLHNSVSNDTSKQILFDRASRVTYTPMRFSAADIYSVVSVQSKGKAVGLDSIAMEAYTLVLIACI